MDADPLSSATGGTRRLRRRWLIAPGLVLLGAILGGRQMLLEEHRQLLMAEVEEAGGSVSIGVTWTERLEAWLNWDSLSEYDDEPSLSLDGPIFSDAWLDVHGNLSELRVRSLTLSDTRMTDRGISRLLNAHDLRILDLTDIQSFGTETVAALEAQTGLDWLILDGVPLTDEGLAALPLEGLTLFSIERTPVTATGLAPLRRCRQLDELWIDGEHLDDTSAAHLQLLPTLRCLYVMGKNVTDEDARALRGMTQLEEVSFAPGAAISKEMLEDLRRSLPGCDISPPSEHTLVPCCGFGSL